jgi:protein-disulfide isomerase
VTPAGRSRSKTPFYLLLGGIAAIAAGFMVYQATRPKVDAVSLDPNTPLPKAEGYLLGDSAARVQVLEFADFECPACGQFATVTEPDVRKRLVEAGTISIRFLDFPLSQHRNSWSASMAAACANEQGKFWEMHDAIFESQDRWNGTVTSRPKGVFQRLATTVGLNVNQWESCFDSQKYGPNITANLREGERRMVQQTPTFVIGAKMIPGALNYDQFKAYVDTALAAAPAPGSPLGGDTALRKDTVPASKSKSK